jgi:nucleoside-diphosphate-sugar epimerase
LKILVTGASGFIGTNLCERLIHDGIELTKVSRKSSDPILAFKNIDGNSDWSKILDDIDCVIHTANIAHAGETDITDDDYLSVNTEGTLNLAQQALENGVKKFIFISSVLVHGNKSNDDYALKEELKIDESKLIGYAKSKALAEKGLKTIAENSPMDLLILRPPMVYGKNAKGNFRLLTNMINFRVPLPIGSISTKRSFIYVDNLIDFIITLVRYPKSIDGTFLISDDHDLSIKDLVSEVAEARGIKSLTFPFPVKILRFILKILRPGMETKILDPFVIDIKKARSMMDWKPPYTVKEAMRETFRSLKT